MLAYMLHRISGLGMIIFVSLHVVASFSMQQFGSTLGTTINTIYESVYFQVLLYFCVIFHTLNGLRIVILDFWPKLLEFQREATWVQWAVFIPVYALTVFVMLYIQLSGG